MSASVSIKIDKLEELFAPYNRVDRPGLAVGVAHRGRPVFRKGFGLAHAELPMVLTPSMRARIGSTSKHFCCLAIMLLAEEGKLDTRASVRRYVPELQPWAERVTLAQIMSHTSGVPCSLDILSATSAIMSRPLPHEEQVKLLAQLSAPNFEPGETWMYSNGGYVLLTEIVRRLSGVSFEAFLQERILDPVGMFDTLARPTDTTLLPNSATLHVPNATGGFDRGVFGPDIGGEGSIVSTVDDMLRWLAHMSKPVVGSAATWAEMRTPAVLNNGVSTGYGYGLAMENYRGLKLVGHGGTVIGGNCQMFKVLDHELDVILISNMTLDVPSLGEKVIEACFDDLPVLAPPEEERALPEGAFYSPATGRYAKFVRHNDHIALDFSGVPYPLLPTPGRPRYWLRTNMKDGMVIRALDDGAIEVEEFGRERLEPAQKPDPDEARALVGAYAAADLGATARLEATETGAQFKIAGPFGVIAYAMEPIAPGAWQLVDPRTKFSAQLERSGRDLLFSSSRARRLRFEPAAPSA